MTLHTPHIDWFALSPILALIGTSFAALLCAVLVPRAVRRVAAAAIVGCSASRPGSSLAIWLYVDSADGHTIVSGAFYRDRWTALGQVILCAVGLATTLLAVEHIPAGAARPTSIAATTTWRSSSRSSSPRPRGWRSSSAPRT